MGIVGQLEKQVVFRVSANRLHHGHLTCIDTLDVGVVYSLEEQVVTAVSTNWGQGRHLTLVLALAPWTPYRQTLPPLQGLHPLLLQ